MSTASVPLLVVRDVVKSFARRGGALRVLDGAGLSASDGEFIAIQGASGCGKTTLLLALGTLQRPDSGIISIDGVEPYACSPNARAVFRARAIGFVFQQFHLIPYLNVRDNVLVSSLGAEMDDAGARADALLERFGLTPRRAHLPAELSSGERQRTALARAMLHHPVLLLADEPTGNLDSDNAGIVLSALREYASEGHIVVMVTHNPHAADAAQRIMHLSNGRLA